jgi:hypothetical protein
MYHVLPYCCVTRHPIREFPYISLCSGLAWFGRLIELDEFPPCLCRKLSIFDLQYTLYQTCTQVHYAYNVITADEHISA